MEKEFKSGHNWIGKPNPYPYKEQDLLAQKTFQGMAKAIANQWSKVL